MLQKTSFLSPVRVSVIFVLGISLLVLSACSVMDEGDKYGPDSRTAESRDHAGTDRSTSAVFMPWERWIPRQDLRGAGLSDTNILRGDEYMRAGNRELAQKEYQKASGRKLPAAEREALVMRSAGNFIALGQGSSALKILSDHFRAVQTPVAEVGAEFSLLFGYAYGDSGNIDQSLAWFSRARASGGATGNAGSFAEAGVQALLRSVSEDKLDETDRNWSYDSFINALIGKERSRRAHGGQVSPVLPGKGRFWQADVAIREPDRQLAGERQVVGGITSVAGYPTIGVLLPLSGRYGGLGKSVKGGIEIALEAANSESQNGTFRATFKDSGGSAAGAVGAAADLVAQDQAGVIIGPLLSEEAGPVADTSRQTATPILAFTKASDFQTGGGVFRLGPTVESQVSSLLREVSVRLGFRNFAIVYPEDAGGHDFAEAFKRKAQEMGLAVVFAGSYMKDDSGAMLAITEQLEALGDKLDAIFLPDSLQAASRFSGALSARLKEHVRLLGTASWDNPAEISNSRTALDGAIFVSPFFSLSPEPVVARFVASFESRFKRRPDFLAAQGFDAAVMVLAAAQKQLTEKSGFTEAFSSIEAYSGLTGQISVLPSGELERRFRVVQLRGDNLGELERETPLIRAGSEGAAFKSSYIEDAARSLYGESGMPPGQGGGN